MPLRVLWLTRTCCIAWNAASARAPVLSTKQAPGSGGAAGHLIWVTCSVDSHTDDITALVAVGDTVLMSGDAGGVMKCWHQASGALLWTAPHAHRGARVVFIAGVDRVPGTGAVSIVSGDSRGRLCGFSGSGEVVWHTSLAPSDVAAAAVLAGSGAGGGRGRSTLGGGVGAGVVLTPGCFVVAVDSVLAVAVDATSGKLLCKLPQSDGSVTKGAATHLACSGKYLVAVYSLGGLHAWRWAWEDVKGQAEPQLRFHEVGNYFHNPDVSQTRFAKAFVCGRVVYATVSDGSVLAVDLHSGELGWHSEQVMVAPQGLHVIDSRLYCGTMSGLTTLNRQRMQIWGAEVVHNVEQESARRDVLMNEFLPPIMFLVDARA